MSRRATLREIAHARSGEKGPDSNISVFAYHPDDYYILLEQVTTAAVTRHFAGILRGEALRYAVPSVSGLNFVMRDVLEGGRTRTLAFEESGHGVAQQRDVVSGGGYGKLQLHAAAVHGRRADPCESSACGPIRARYPLGMSEKR